MHDEGSGDRQRWSEEHHLIVAALVALGLVAAIGLTTGATPPANDGLHYLNVAEEGLVDNPRLAAPFAYRFGTPIIVRLVHRVTSLGVPDVFLIVALLSTWGTLIAAYLLARSVRATMAVSLAAMAAVAFSFFHVKFPLAVPTMVDVQGFLLIMLALWALLKDRYGTCLVLSCLGIFFKEFLIVPALLIIVQKSRVYIHRRETVSLLWVLTTLCLAIACFVIPRIAIPVTVGYGVNMRWDFGAPGHREYFEYLRYFLPGAPDAGRLVNLCFALSSYWLPVLLLATPARMKDVWEDLSSLRLICMTHVSLVVLLALFGGTNIMIFVAYTVPVLVIVLVSLLRRGIHPAETAVALVALLLFNRIPFVMGGAATTIDDLLRFYGGWWSRVDEVTAGRTLEISGFILLLCVVRLITRRTAKSESSEEVIRHPS